MACNPVWCGIVGFNIPLDTVQVISETILRVRWPNQQCHSTDGQWSKAKPPGFTHQKVKRTGLAMSTVGN